MTDSKDTFFAHETAILDDGCEVGEGSKIWHFSHVMGGAKIGNGCVLGQNVFVGKDVKIGNQVKIQNNVSVFAGVTLEDGVFCGPSMVFTNVMNPRSEIERKDEYRNTLVKKGVSIGANATIICGITIGEYAFIGAGSVVTKDVPAHALMYGVPAKDRGWMCACGHQLKAVVEKLTCPDCNTHYDLTDHGLVAV